MVGTRENDGVEGDDSLRVWGFYFEVIKCLKLIMVMVAQLCEYTKNNWVVIILNGRVGWYPVNMWIIFQERGYQNNNNKKVTI